MPQNIGDNRISSDGIARITPQDAARLGRYRVEPGDIVYSRRGDVERRALVRDPEAGWLCGTGCLRVRFGNDVVDPLYASYYLGHPEVRAWIVRHAIGATMPNLNTGILSALPFVKPPVQEQRAIASILGALDDKIELNRRMNATVEAVARALFQSWFVDFDPVRAKMEGRQPAGMDAETAALFPGSFQYTHLGYIPTGWQPQQLDQTITLTGGGTPKTSMPAYWGGDISWFSVVDAPARSQVFVVATQKSITDAGLQNSSTCLLPTGTTIISARGTVGKCALVGVPMAMNQSCYAVRGADDRGDYFTYFTLLHSLDDLQRSAHGSVFDTITRDTFKAITVTAPPLALTQAFDETIAPVLGRILHNLHESCTLNAMRDALLPKLLSGEIRVNELG